MRLLVMAAILMVCLGFWYLGFDAKYHASQELKVKSSNDRLGFAAAHQKDLVAKQDDGQSTSSLSHPGASDEDLAVTRLKLVTTYEQDPDNVSATEQLALFYLNKMQNPELALTFMKRTLQLDPDNSTALDNIIALVEKSGDTVLELNELEALADSQSLSGSLYRVVAQKYLELEQPQQAIRCLEKSVAINDRLAYSSDMILAQNYAATGDTAKSLASFEAALSKITELNNKNFGIDMMQIDATSLRYDYARQLLKSGRPAEAASVLEDLLALDPSNKVYRGLLQNAQAI